MFKKEELVDFLVEKPGYIKKGAKTLRKIIKRQGFKVSEKICRQALQEVRSRLKNRPTFKKEPKILHYDIETAYGIAKAWRPGWKIKLTQDNFIVHPRIICISYKWNNSDEVNTLRWDSNQDDKLLLENFIPVLNEADFSVGHNCVTKNTKILKEDLTWTNAENLKVGDELVGFDEGKIGKVRNNEKWITSTKRNFKKSIVIGHEIKTAPVYRITFDDNSYVDTTKDHKWLGMSPNCNTQTWYSTNKLVKGYRCYKPFNYWEEQLNYNSGYLSGVIDSDGSISKKGDYRIAIYQSTKVNLDICNKIEKILNFENIEYSIDEIETSKIISTSYKGREKIKNICDNNSITYRFLGSVYDKIELIGKYNIQKGKRIFTSDNIGSIRVPKDRIKTIISKELIGEKEIVVMQTSTKTFIGNGYMMHNCDKFDFPWIKTRALFHGLSMYPKYKSVDTLKIARYKHNFPSNRLDDIGEYLNLGRKIKVDYKLWDRVILEQSEEALDEMVAYCEQDVLLLEKIYNKLTEFELPTVHNGVMQGTSKLCSPYTGGTNIERVKTTTSKAGTIKHMMICKDSNKYFEMSNTVYNKFKELKK